MAMVDGDWTITRSTGDIRYIGGDHDNSPSYATVIEFHRWLQDFADDEVFTGDDEHDITDITSSDRSTDNIITLLSTFNIDDNAAEHLYDGSIIQGTGGTEVFYDGIVNFGNADVQIQVLQNGAVIADDWWNQSGAGINPDAGAGISHRFMVKTRSAGADIDGRRLVGMSRTFGNTYAEFNINGTSRGNNVLALTDAADLNNATAIATIAGYTGITNTTEGYNGIDVDLGGDDFFYSEWNTNQPTRSINDFYERHKWITKDPVTEDTATETGTDYVVDNATILGQAQAWANGANAMLVTKATVKLKIAAGTPTGNMTASIFDTSGTFGSTMVPTTIVGTASDAILAETLDATYRDVTFNFATPVPVLASTEYALVIEHPTATAGNNVHVRGDATGTHAGNKAELTGGWAAQAAEDLGFDVYTSPDTYEIPGILFRGITHEIDVDGGAGTWQAVEPVSWSGGTGQLLAVNNLTASSSTKIWIQLLTGVVPSNNDTITGGESSATVLAELTTGTITSRALSTPPVGASTGSAIIGSYGLGIEAADLTAADKVFDLTNTLITPPNNVTFTVFGLIASEDRVLVTNDDTSNIDFNQMTLDTALTGGTETNVNVQPASVPADTPSTGNLRILLDDGRYRLVPYTAVPDTSNFTIASTDFSGGNSAADDNNVFLGYIDKLAGATSEAFTTVYDSDRTLFIRVRDGDSTPIKTFETTGTLASTGGSVTAIRTPDA